jgi:epoxyqueuosine reductase
MGNRIFGCDDCQLVCPWNRYARPSDEPAFAPRHGLDAPQLTELFAWSEPEWSKRTAGSALRRPGYLGWLRNIAVALGNAPSSPPVLAALQSRVNYPSDLVQEHVAWALDRHAASKD